MGYLSPRGLEGVLRSRRGEMFYQQFWYRIPKKLGGRADLL